MKKTKADAVRAWLLKARKDLETARQMHRQGSDYADIVCFHAQQAAEKGLKGYLVWLGIDFPKTHVLEDLLDLIAPVDTSLERWRAELQALSPLAVETRYPEFALPSHRRPRLRSTPQSKSCSISRPFCLSNASPEWKLNQTLRGESQ